MSESFIRSEIMFGKEAMEHLKNSRVAVFGLGGVGSYAAEALVRSGIGEIDFIDKDDICESNLNRQLLATYSTIGKPKVEVAKERALSINPYLRVNAFKEFFLPDTAYKFDFKNYDYVVDAVDNVTAKLLLVQECDKVNTGIISVMGTGNKKDPTLFEVSDIYSTSVCPLAKVMRKELKKRNITSLKVVYSKEEAIHIKAENENERPVISSNSFVPPVAGMIAASEVIKDIIAKKSCEL